jgi:hypothetical protein
MATLNSPGVQVQVKDESFYTPAAPGTVPLVIVASASNKSNASATGTAAGTTKANAGTVWVITSQRDLTDTFGTPLFPTVNGSSVNGGEQNEYGLQAAYSSLGISSRAYIARADVDLSQLSPASTPPEGSAVSGTYWVNTADTLFGINEWSTATNSFTVKTPLVIDDSNMSAYSTDTTPNSGFGQAGDYAVYATSENLYEEGFLVWYKDASLGWYPVYDGIEGKSVVVGPHYQYPNFTDTGTGALNAVDGSVWIKTTTPGYGANFDIKYYNGTTKTWVKSSVNVYPSSTATSVGIAGLDPVGGGSNIAVGTLYVESNYNHDSAVVANSRIWRRAASGPTTVKFTTNSATGYVDSSMFYFRETNLNGVWSDIIPITVAASSSTMAQLIVEGFNNKPGLSITRATYNSVTNSLTFTHANGGDIELVDGHNNPIATGVASISPYDPITGSGVPFLNTGYDDLGAGASTCLLISNWRPLVYQSLPYAPSTAPADGTLWYDDKLEADIMINDGTSWVGYQNYTGFDMTNATGPIFSASEPHTQTDGSTALQNGDIWIDTSDLEMFGKNIYVYSGTYQKWIIQDVTDHTSPTGWLFADARWSGAGDDDPTTFQDSIKKLLTYDYVDPDCPDPALYPRGTRLWNTRRSGYNVKKYSVGHIDIYANHGQNIRYQNDNMSGYKSDRWVTVVAQNANGSGLFGRQSQRGVVVKAIKALIDTNQAIRDTDTVNYNLITCPGYPEAISNMVALNTDRGQTGFVIGDTPFRLPATGTALSNWGSNANLAYDNGDVGAVTNDDYLGLFYPSGLSTDNTGNKIVVPPSHMMLRTIINSDAKAYQWYAPAGTRRGGVDNATSVGYVDATGAFKSVSLYQGLRDVMQSGTTVNINPIATFPGVGLVNYGQKTRAATSSALDRINVVRLVGYLRRQLELMAKPYLFEPNDSQTRREIKAAADSLLLELVGLRAIYDFITVCDESNNTSARVDRSELWLDIAIEPVKAVEFIYIPLRILNTGAIASGNFGSLAAK